MGVARRRRMRPRWMRGGGEASRSEVADTAEAAIVRPHAIDASLPRGAARGRRRLRGRPRVGRGQDDAEDSGGRRAAASRAESRDRDFDGRDVE